MNKHITEKYKGMPFAKASEAIDKKYKDRTTDALQMKAFEEEMNQLFKYQGVAAMKQRMVDKMTGNTVEGENQFAYGNNPWQKGIADDAFNDGTVDITGVGFGYGNNPDLPFAKLGASQLDKRIARQREKIDSELTPEEIKFLAIQKRGTDHPDHIRSYYKKDPSGFGASNLGNLNSDQITQLRNYMKSTSLGTDFIEGITPNINMFNPKPKGSKLAYGNNNPDPVKNAINAAKDWYTRYGSYNANSSLWSTLSNANSVDEVSSMVADFHKKQGDYAPDSNIYAAIKRGSLLDIDPQEARVQNPNALEVDTQIPKSTVDHLNTLYNMDLEFSQKYPEVHDFMSMSQKGITFEKQPILDEYRKNDRIKTPDGWKFNTTPTTASVVKTNNTSDYSVDNSVADKIQSATSTATLSPTTNASGNTELPYQTWQRITGKPWKEAKKLGWSDGLPETNKALQERLLKEGNFLNAPATTTTPSKSNPATADGVMLTKPEEEGYDIGKGVANSVIDYSLQQPLAMLKKEVPTKTNKERLDEVNKLVDIPQKEGKGKRGNRFKEILNNPYTPAYAGAAANMLTNLGILAGGYDRVSPVYNPYEQEVRRTVDSMGFNRDAIANRMLGAVNARREGASNLRNEAVRQAVLQGTETDYAAALGDMSLQEQAASNQVKQIQAQVKDSLGQQRVNAEARAITETAQNKGAFIGAASDFGKEVASAGQYFTTKQLNDNMQKLTLEIINSDPNRKFKISGEALQNAIKKGDTKGLVTMGLSESEAEQLVSTFAEYAKEEAKTTNTKAE